MASGHRADLSWKSPPEQNCLMPNGGEIASLEVSINSSSQNDRSCTFNVPHEIGCYSVRGEKREYINGPDNKRYLRSDILWKGNKWYQPDMNLKNSQEHAVRRDWTKSASLENLLHWVCRNRDNVMPSSADDTQRVHPDFICSRDVLKMFVCTPFLAKDEWRVAARRIEGVVYLRNVLSCEERERRHCAKDEKANWSSRFSENMVTRQPSVLHENNNVVDETQTYHAVLRGQLGTHKIIFDAEVMAIDDSPEIKKPGLNPYVEFRTCIDFHCFKNGEKYRRYKSLKWWAHARLAGVSSLMCGSCSENGTVDYIEKLEVADIPKMTQQHWSEEKCMQICDKILSFIKEHVQGDDSTYLFKLAWKKEEGQSPSRKIVCRLLGNPPAIQVLPDWYLKSFVTGKSHRQYPA
ncbi:decapping and exoribonuclease protein-like isoform X1 [Dermacentor silvarum]|uniref:decapping and exoribonuclease protein-like isoform X1 n=1 Tax=Dermacentor silvarum TaxID=543639 RepID=UPI00210160D3|nr:decapping and exoribonuclease protein-like isoform X1 [Dermacentor silvarum]